MSGLLVDSDVVIDYLRGLGSARYFFSQTAETNTLYLSVITISEVYSGTDLEKKAKLKVVEQFLTNFEIALVTISIAKTAGNLRRNYGRPFADMLVAATALDYGFGLATRNIRHFHGIGGLRLIKPY